MSEQKNEKLRDWKISWEEALEREMEYRKRMKNNLPQHSVDSMAAPSGSQPQRELQKANAIGLKRKVTFESFLQPSTKAFEHKMMPPQPIKDQISPSQRMHGQKPPSQQQPPRQLPFQQFHNMKRPPPHPQSRSLQHHQSWPHHLQVKIERPLRGEFLNQSASVKAKAVCWCNLCKVKCMTPLHLELHRQGKKHKVTLERVWGGKKNDGKEEVWCPECNVKCMNDFSWNQHRVGQKHLARVAKKAIEASDGACSVLKIEKVGCVQEPQKASCAQEQEIVKASVGVPSNKLMNSAFHEQKPRTSNWPNCI